MVGEKVVGRWRVGGSGIVFKFGCSGELLRGSPTRMVIYSHDTFGLGHLRRNLALAQALVKANPQMRIVIVTGSSVAGNFSVGHGIELVELPPVVKVGPDRYQSYGSSISLSLIKRARGAILKDVVDRFDPELFYVDHSPLGMSNELLPVLEYLVSSKPHIRRLIGLRDIIDSPKNVEAGWGHDGVLSAITEFYDQVFVFGEEHLFDFAKAYQLGPDFKAKYLSYLGKPEFIEAGVKRVAQFSSKENPRGHLLITAGGGGDGQIVCELGIRVARQLDIPAVLVMGPLMDRDKIASLVKLCRGNDNIVLTEFSPNIEELVVGARVAFSMAGYNTIVELCAARVPTIYVPRTYPREEQLVRAQIFEKLGFGKMVLSDKWSFEDICSQTLTYWNSPFLLSSAQVNLSAIPRFASQIVVPDTQNIKRAHMGYEHAGVDSQR